jgi:endonuclease/exonuclease/phosphatase (EEP) superfamily protein YafD
VLIVIGAIGAVAGVIGLVAHYYAPRSVYTLALAALSPYFLVPAVVAAVVFAIARGVSGWTGLAVSAVLVVWLAALQAPLFTAASAPAHGRDVVVLTANLRLGGADPHALVALVESHHVDVLMLEELTDEELAALKSAGLDRQLPYSQVAPGRQASGTGLYSRYPISDAHNRPDFGFWFVTARVAVPGLAVPITAVALHMFGPYPSDQTAQWEKDMRHLPGVLEGLPRDAPVLVAGDFNATRDAVQFRRVLQGGYVDAADQAGAGFTPTYPSDRWYPPVIAIDHVLTRGAVARTVDSLELRGSDHRSLLVTVRVPSA